MKLQIKIAEFVNYKLNRAYLKILGKVPRRKEW